MHLINKTTRLPKSLIARIEAHAKQQTEQNGTPTRFSDVVRFIIHRHFAMVDALNNTTDND